MWRKIGYLGPVTAVVLFISPLAFIAWFRAAVKLCIDAVKTRACDVIVGDDGLSIAGGSARGFRASWQEIAGANIGWTEQDGLSVALPGRTLRVPAPRDKQERTSLHALYETLAATSRGARAERPHREPPDLVRCAQCGAALAPSAETKTTCRHCGAEATLPDSIVDRVKALSSLTRERKRDEARLAALLRQPGPWAANAVAFIGGLSLLFGAIVTALVTLGLAFVDGREAGMPRLHGIGPIVMGACLLVVALSIRLLATRGALRLVTLGLAAEPPARAGDPCACRECGGPLVEPAPGASLVTCVYCRTTNVRLVDAQQQAAVVGPSERKSPHDVLATVARRKTASIIIFAIAIALLGAGLAWTIVWSPLKLDRARAVEVPFENVREAFSPDPAEAGPDARAISRIAHFEPMHLVFASDGARVDLIAMADASTQVTRLGESQPWLSLKRSPALWARSRRGLATLSSRGLELFDESGKAEVVQSWAALGDPHGIELRAGPEGAFLVTTRASPEGHLRLRRVEDARASIVLEDVREAAFAHDDPRAVVTALVDDRLQLALLPSLSATTGELLTRGKGNVRCPTWSPDGRAIAFLSESIRDSMQYGIRYGQRRLFSIDLETRTLRQLTAGGPLERTCPVWTPDGIYVVATEQEIPTGPFLRTVLLVTP
ncbi:MAG: hypothetical protein HOV80_07895 [Polyangiaceae bacterium]|nr:hypothetical protein [Polyangiaceae bacterium]